MKFVTVFLIMFSSSHPDQTRVHAQRMTESQLKDAFDGCLVLTACTPVRSRSGPAYLIFDLP